MPRVKCCVCGQSFDYTKEQGVKSKIHKRRYSHYNCEPDGELVPLPEDFSEERQELFKYCEKLFGNRCNYKSIGRSLKEFTSPPYNYTYKGIKKALYYFYEIKGNSVEKANGGINIVPYIWNECFNYYYAIWEAQQKNQPKEIKRYIPQKEQIIIPVPQATLTKKKKFNFLDETGE